MKRNKALIRATIDAYSSTPFDWRADVHTLTNSQRVDLTAAAKEFGYRKGINSYFSLGAAFFLYLCKDPALTAPVDKQPGERWSNDGLAKGKS